jgi:isopenicillin-N N-acyltransferase-like protein
LIEIAGSPYDRGCQYGAAAGREIAVGIRHYAAQVAELGLAGPSLNAVIDGYKPIMEDFSPTLIEEMRGIARGAEVDFRDIVLLNARTEILKIAANADLLPGLRDAVEPDACTSVVVEPKASSEGNLIHAHNWDWKMEAADAVVVLRVRSMDGPDCLLFTEAGAVCRFGMNTLGVAITANYLESERDYERIGVPLTMIRRRLLQEPQFALGLSCVYTTPKSGSNNMLVSEANAGLALDFECAPDETFMVDPVDGLLVHANHWQSLVALGKLKDTGVRNMPDSLYRDRRVRQLLQPKIGSLTVADVKAALLDNWATPWSVCRPPRPSLTTNLSATVVTLIMQPALRRMEIAVLPALDPTFTTYTLDT